MMTRNKIFGGAGLMAMLAFSAWSALAQAGNQAPAPPPLPDENAVWIYAGGPGADGPPPEAIAIVGFEGGFAGKTVTGVPFTATTSLQTSQTLSDGNKIERTTTGTFARDSQGRTRRDMTILAIGPWAASGKTSSQVSMINDPVAGVHYLLEPDKKVARQLPAGAHKHGGKHHGPPAGEAAEGSADQANVTTTSLGTQTINGVSATGTRTVRTIPAGAIGNEKPIIITTERWYSADLQTVVMTKRSDPRTGDFVMQLTNIQRTEPDASLFQVPADYTIEKGHPRGKFGPKPLGD
jgi:hypothetical protein